MKNESNHIGFDPVIWAERLLDVNEGSKFTEKQKSVIREHLESMRQELEKLS